MAEDIKTVVAKLLKWLDPIEGDVFPSLSEIHETLGSLEAEVTALKLRDRELEDKFCLIFDDTEMKLVFESVATMRMTAMQRLEMAGMGKRTEGEKMFLHDKMRRLSAIEDRFLILLNPNAARLRDEGEDVES